MKRVDNPELTRLMLDHLSSLYKLKQKREGIHLSTLVYCITRSFFDQINGIEPTTNEVMLFAIGLGLQDVLTPKEAEVPVYEKGGITFSPDMVFKLPGFDMVELKTTRMSMNRPDLPKTWEEYIMGGCYMMGVNFYDLSVVYIIPPDIKSERLEFTADELQSNWDYLLERKAVYCRALEKRKPPQPYKYCKDWECKRCRYKLQCNAISLLGDSPEPPEKEPDAR